jgi:hypothetical protein
MVRQTMTLCIHIAGELKYADGDKYVGAFDNGQKHGQGTYVTLRPPFPLSTTPSSFASRSYSAILKFSIYYIYSFRSRHSIQMGKFLFIFLSPRTRRAGTMTGIYRGWFGGKWRYEDRGRWEGGYFKGARQYKEEL